MFDNYDLLTILYAVIIFIVSVFVVKIVFYSKRLLGMVISAIVIVLLAFLLKTLNMPYGETVFDNIIKWIWLVVIILNVSEIKDGIEHLSQLNVKSTKLAMGSEKTRLAIVNAVEELSQNQIGGLITIEKHNTLDQYAQKAITLDSEVSEELLTNIFIPNTPLHDGAVIIRGDRIVCAGAYFVLSSNETFNKSTTGSRHRAGLGISEITDAMTIIVSEETGGISIAIEGIMLKMNSKDKLLEYLNTFMK